MSGSRHHIVPRFMLKGFSSRVEKDECYSWVYQKNNNAFEANIRKIGVKRDFYGKDEDLNADAAITDFENRYADYIDYLRNCANGYIIDELTISNLVAHFCVRTKHLRDSFRESTEYLVDIISVYLENPDNLIRLILDNPKLIEDEMNKALLERGVPLEQRIMMMGLAKNLAPLLLENNKEFLNIITKQYIELLGKIIPSAMRSGHIKALMNNPIPEPRVDDYKGLKWFVKVMECPIILGDSIVLFKTNKNVKPINENKDILQYIFLPISSNRLVIGTSTGKYEDVDININNIIARCSKDYFVSSQKSNECDELSNKIDTQSFIIDKSEIEQIVYEIFHKGLES